MDFVNTSISHASSKLEVLQVEGQATENPMRDDSMDEAQHDYEALAKIEAQFDKTIKPQEVDTKEDGKLDSVILDDGHSKRVVPLDVWRQGQFNFLDQRIDRDDTQKVENNLELIEKFNSYNFEGKKVSSSGLGKTVGYVLSVASFGCWVLSRRKTVPPGQFGHYISSSKHMLTTPGIHTIISTTEKWSADIMIDDEDHPNRKFGDKVILQVPENHLAGGYRIGSTRDKETGQEQKEPETRDQEFVLFSQGRHVLPESKYYGVDIIKLTNNRMNLGPLTILYVREGWLGGVLNRKTGVYRLLYPGPPYVLHEQDYEQAELVERLHDVFRVGPYEFVTVKHGSIAGTYRKTDGKFQILPPGSSYQLNLSLYQKSTLITRTKKFNLGPFYFLTVSNGEEAGVYRKKDGLFVRLYPGKTYQLNEDNFGEPILVKRHSHVTIVGPLTLLTVQQGTLNGAYRVSDGKFVEFEDPSVEYILHEKEFHGLITVPRNSTDIQYFGPFKVITIREGYVGQFEVEGKIEIKDPGYYKVESNVNIYDPIPVKIFQEILPNLDFRTKDGVQMAVKATITWSVTNAKDVAKFSGNFKSLQSLVRERAGDALIRLCKMYNRGDLLPTAQDLEHHRREGQTEAELTKMAEDSFKMLQKTLSETSRTELCEISATSNLGITVKKVQIERFDLKNIKILEELESITKAKVSANRERAEGEYLIVKADLEMRAREKMAQANASVALAEAKAEADVRRTNMEMENSIRLRQSQLDNEILKEKNDTEMQVLYNKQIKEAEAKAKSILAITEAEYQKKVKECEAASKMPPQEFELRKMQLQVDMLREVGQAAWKYPDVFTGLLQQFGDKLRLGPLTVDERY